jgi:protein-S-isoprenylcysteine O-methyltransferase Ste14
VGFESAPANFPHRKTPLPQNASSKIIPTKSFIVLLALPYRIAEQTVGQRPRKLRGILMQRSAMKENRSFPWWPAPNSKLYDILAASPAIAFYGLSIARNLPVIATELESADFNTINFEFVTVLLAQIAAAVFLALALLFMFMRSPAKAKARGLVPRVMAFCGTYLGVLVVWLPPQPMDLRLSLISLFLILGGLVFSAISLSHLGRSFSLMAEARRLITDGPYALVRHPLYFGEAVSLLGMTLQFHSPLAFTLMAAQFAFQFQRMKNEENVLAAQFPEYEAYRLRTARVLPGLY